jgi:flagellar export protein FliJ
MYKFRFARLMEVKERLLEQKQQEVEDAMAALADLVAGIVAVEEEMTARENDLATRCMTGKEFSLLMGGMAYLDDRKTRLKDLKVEADARMEELKKELSALAVELKMLEKLKAKDMREARKAAYRKEQKVMDDLALRTGGR